MFIHMNKVSFNDPSMLYFVMNVPREGNFLHCL